MALTAKQARFVEAYVGNATEAAKEAGYSERTAYSQGQRLLKNVEVSQAIKEREAARTGALISTREERLATLTAIARDETIPTRDRLKALDILNRACGDYVTKVEVEQQGPVVYRWMTEDDVR